MGFDIDIDKNKLLMFDLSILEELFKTKNKFEKIHAKLDILQNLDLYIDIDKEL